MSTAAETTATKAPRSKKPSAEPTTSKTPSPSPSPSAESSPPPSSESPSPSKVFVVRRKMRVNGQWRMPGEVVPEAQDWPRVESMVRAGFLNEEMR